MKSGIITLFLFIYLGIGWDTPAQNILNWQALTELNQNLPEEIKLYKAAGKINGDTITAYYSSVNILQGNFILFPLYSETNEKPESFFEKHIEDTYIITNGGFFGTNVSYSLVLQNYQTVVPNIRALTRSHNGQNYTYYPTRSAFGMYPDLSMEAAYIYTFSNDNKTYAYPEASPNTTDSLPLPQPSPDYPPGGLPWNVSEAIGGGPLLIRDSTINTNYTPELFYSDITQSQAPRTAIGCTSDGRIINLVVDGRQSHSKGATLQVLSEILLELGCIEAINLDGGGSSAIMVYDSIINKPSDGATRKMPTVVTIKKATLFDTEMDFAFHYHRIPDDTSSGNSFGQSGSLIFSDGYCGTYFFPELSSALYRLDVYLSTHDDYDLSDSVLYVLSNGTSSPDSICINQGSVFTSGFQNLGFFHVSSQDSLAIFNKSQGKYAYIDAIRLVKTGSSLPLINLDMSTNSGNYATGEQIHFIYNALSQTPSRLLTRIKIVETYQGMEQTLTDIELDNYSQVRDTFLYMVPYEAGTIDLHFIAFDSRNDSAYTTFTIDIQNRVPLIGFGIQSVMEGNLGDTLILQIIMNAASQTRPLDRLVISEYQNNSLSYQEEIHLSGFLAEEFYYHKIEPSDLQGLQVICRVYDNLNYQGEIDFMYSSNLADSDIELLPFAYFDAKNKMLCIHLPECLNPIKTGIMIYHISGQSVLKSFELQETINNIPLSDLKNGVYIAKICAGSKVSALKFVK